MTKGGRGRKKTNRERSAAHKDGRFTICLSRTVPEYSDILVHLDLIYNTIESDRSSLLGKLIVAGLHSPQGRDAFAKAYMAGSSVDELAKGRFVDVDGLLRHFGASALNVFSADDPGPSVPVQTAMASAFLTEDDEDDDDPNSAKPGEDRGSLLSRSPDAFSSADAKPSDNSATAAHKAHIRTAFVR